MPSRREHRQNIRALGGHKPLLHEERRERGLTLGDRSQHS
jgi:hypothetical protein